MTDSHSHAQWRRFFTDSALETMDRVQYDRSIRDINSTDAQGDRGILDRVRTMWD